MNETSPKISIIIPAFNAERFIEKCLVSLQNQTFKNFEIVVVDDNSSDETGKIAQKYAKVIRNNKNLGEGASRNKGSQLAEGEILVYTDADVILPSDWLENILTDMEKYKVKCVGGGYRGSVGDTFLEKFCYLELEYRRKNMEGFANTLVSNNFACHRDIFFECGGFDENYKCEDLRLSYKISRKYKIFWDKNNGVYHHFRKSLKSYLRQQFYFGRDTLWTYFKYPGLFLVKTHQGHELYFEVTMIFLLYVFLAVWPLGLWVPLGGIALINSGFLKFLKSNKIPVIKSFFLILLRDIVCSVSIIAGIILCFKQIFKDKFHPII